MRYFFLLLIVVSYYNSYSQVENSYDNLVTKGMHQTSTIEAFYIQNVDHDFVSSYGKVITAFCNNDTTKVILITEEVSRYDPTNNIREDEHNKVNFITADAFQERYANKHILRTIASIYCSGPDSTNHWFQEVSDSADYFIKINHETLTNYVAGQIQPFFIDLEKNELLPVFWNSGRFAPSADLRLHPDWENYGKNVWKNRELMWRPFIGLPVLVRDFYLKKFNNHGY